MPTKITNAVNLPGEETRIALPLPQEVEVGGVHASSVVETSIPGRMGKYVSPELAQTVDFTKIDFSTSRNSIKRPYYVAFPALLSVGFHPTHTFYFASLHDMCLMARRRCPSSGSCHMFEVLQNVISISKKAVRTRTEETSGCS